METIERSRRLPLEQFDDASNHADRLPEGSRAPRQADVEGVDRPRPETEPDERSHTNWLRVAEVRRGELFEAAFCLRLTGVSAKSQPGWRNDEREGQPARAFDIWTLARLAERRRAGPICIELSNNGSSRTPVECLIGSRALDSTEKGAIGRAGALLLDMSRTMGRPDADYVFEPCKAPDGTPDERPRRTVRLARRSVLIGFRQKSPAGFSRGSAGTPNRGQVRAPMSPSWGRLDHTLHALASERGQVRVRFQTTRVRLSADEIASLIRTRAWLTDPTPKGFTYEGLADGHVPGDPALLADIDRVLAAWIRRPEGVRIECDVLASGYVPEPILTALDYDFNGLAPVASAEQMSGGDDTVDLSSLAHETAGSCDLLPSRAALHDLGTRRVLAAPCRDQHTGPIIGRLPGATDDGVRIPERSRDRHCYVIGATGCGKSTLLYNLIVQDLDAGHGLCLLDPHGELFDWVLRSIPASRRDDVRLIDPYDPEWVVGFNPLECRGLHRRWQMQMAASELIRIIDHLYDLEKTGGPMFEAYMRNALFLVMDDLGHGGTLLDVVRVFEDREYRRSLIAACSDLAVADFWTKQAERATGEASLTGMTPYITSKLNQFSQNALLAPIVGQRNNTISFPDLLREGRILLVNLSIGQLGVRDAQLLGMLTMSGLLRAAVSSQPGASGRARRMHVCLDEFQYFLTDAAADALAQGRKFGLSLTMAHQHVGQLATGSERFGTRLLDAVLGNAATKLLFRVGPVDVERLQGWVRPHLDGEHLLHLADHDVVACLAADGRPAPPMIVETLPKMACPYDQADPAEIRARQSHYARPRRTVEAEVFRRVSPPRRTIEAASIEDGASDTGEPSSLTEQLAQER